MEYKDIKIPLSRFPFESFDLVCLHAFTADNIVAGVAGINTVLVTFQSERLVDADNAVGL